MPTQIPPDSSSVEPRSSGGNEPEAAAILSSAATEIQTEKPENREAPPVFDQLLEVLRQQIQILCTRAAQKNDVEPVREGIDQTIRFLVMEFDMIQKKCQRCQVALLEEQNLRLQAELEQEKEKLEKLKMSEKLKRAKENFELAKKELEKLEWAKEMLERVEGQLQQSKEFNKELQENKQEGEEIQQLLENVQRREKGLQQLRERFRKDLGV